MKRQFSATSATRFPAYFVGLGLVASFLAGCAGPSEYFVLQPAKDGSTGSMRATSKEGKGFVLDAKNTNAQSRGGAIEAAKMDSDSVKKMFQSTLDAQPLPPSNYRLYFAEGGDQLTPDSQTQLDAILEEIKRRPAPDLVIVGHTDRVGSVEDNDKLALRRAGTIRQIFETRGVIAENIQTAGRGEREPLVPTADEVAEARNRRVEILVR